MVVNIKLLQRESDPLKIFTLLNAMEINRLHEVRREPS